MGLATGRHNVVMARLEGLRDPIASLSLEEVGATITSTGELGLVSIVGLSMALGELLVSLAAVKRWVLLLQIQSSRTGRLVPVWIGRIHPDNQLFGFLQQDFLHFWTT